MAGEDLPWRETARRLRAAIAYAGSPSDFGRSGAAAAMGVSVSQVDRMIGTRTDSPLTATWQQRRDLAIAAGLPPAFFFAEFAQLDEIVPAGLPRFASPGPTQEELEEAAQASEDAAQHFAPTNGRAAEAPADQPPVDPPARRRKAR